MSRLARSCPVRALGPVALWLSLLVPQPVPAATVDVEIAGYRFTPAEIRIKVGDRVRWLNREQRSSHSILWPASGEESPRLFPGEDWERTFERSGRYLYRCGPHPEMQGRIDVE